MVKRTAGAARKEISERRRERQMEEVRADILRSAARAFARQGYQASTMQQIAAEAGYSAGSLYTYFDSKEAIFETLLADVLDALYGCFEAPVKESSLGDRLESLLRRLFQVAESRRDVFALYLRLTDGVELMTFRAKVPRERPEAFATAFASWLELHARPGELGKTSCDEAGRVLNGIGHAFVTHWLHDPKTSLVEQARRVAGYFLRGVRG